MYNSDAHITSSYYKIYFRWREMGFHLLLWYWIVWNRARNLWYVCIFITPEYVLILIITTRNVSVAQDREKGSGQVSHNRSHWMLVFFSSRIRASLFDWSFFDSFCGHVEVWLCLWLWRAGMILYTLRWISKIPPVHCALWSCTVVLAGYLFEC